VVTLTVQLSYFDCPGVPPSQIKLDLGLSVLKPLSLEWAIDSCAYLATMKDGIIKDYSKIGLLQALTDKKYQLASMRHAPRLFAGMEEFCFVPPIPSELLPFTDQPFPTMVEDDEAVPLVEVEAAVLDRQQGNLLPPLVGAEDTDAAFMVPAPVLLTSLTAYQLAVQLSGQFLTELDEAGLMAAAEGKQRKKKKAQAIKPAAPAPAVVGEKRVRGRPKGSKNKPKAKLPKATVEPERQQEESEGGEEESERGEEESEREEEESGREEEESEEEEESGVEEEESEGEERVESEREESEREESEREESEREEPEREGPETEDSDDIALAMLR
jgi:hypothetical protein